MRAVLALAVIGLLCGAVTAQDNPKVIEAIRKVEASFSNITHLTTAPGLGALFTPDGVWCSLMGSPCNVGAANITAYVNGFKGMLKMTDAYASFTNLNSNGNYGSFDYVKTFSCGSPCGARTCLVRGKSGIRVAPDTSTVVELDDYVAMSDFVRMCLQRCQQC